jgi:hypothetical protein
MPERLFNALIFFCLTCFPFPALALMRQRRCCRIGALAASNTSLPRRELRKQP